MPYTTPTFLTVLQALGARLSDPTFVHWTLDELTRYVHEALRTWNAYTASSRDHGVFSATLQEPFYDLPTKLPTLRGYSQSVWDLLLDCQYSLLEPPSRTVWVGSAQFDLSVVVGAITRRRDQFLQDTGTVLTRLELPISPPPQGRVTLPESTLTIRRAAWRSVPEQIVTPLIRDDEWGIVNYQPAWQQTPTRPPLAYSVAATPATSLQLAPPPADTGVLDLLSVQTGATLDTAVGTVLGVPDDWAWVVKFGVLADLLGRDGLAYDPLRAAYCEARWQQGIEAARRAPVVLAARVNDVSVPVGSLADADSYQPLWQSVAGPVRHVLLAGHSTIALMPPSSVLIGGGTASISLDVVRNMAVPTAFDQAIQLGADQIDTLLDYAQHLATFKEGPAQLDASQPLADRFFRACGVTVNRQQASQPARAALLGQQRQDERAQPRVLPAEVMD